MIGTRTRPGLDLTLEQLHSLKSLRVYNIRAVNLIMSSVYHIIIIYIILCISIEYLSKNQQCQQKA